MRPSLSAISRRSAAILKRRPGTARNSLARLWQRSTASRRPARRSRLRQMILGGDLSFEDAMAMEYRIVSRICRAHDFYEGVRATIVDKDNRPDWRPARGEPIDSSGNRRLFRAARRATNSSFRERRREAPHAAKPRRRHSDHRCRAARGRWRIDDLGHPPEMGDRACLVHAHAGLGLGRQGTVQLVRGARLQPAIWRFRHAAARAAGNDRLLSRPSTCLRPWGFGWRRRGAACFGCYARSSRRYRRCLARAAPSSARWASPSMSRWSASISRSAGPPSRSATERPARSLRLRG